MPRLEPGPELDQMLCEALPIADGPMVQWPELSTTGDGMLLLMEAMEKRGWLCAGAAALKLDGTDSAAMAAAAGAEE